jgi:hypothetical protein
MRRLRTFEPAVDDLTHCLEEQHQALLLDQLRAA